MLGYTIRVKAGIPPGLANPANVVPNVCLPVVLHSTLKTAKSDTIKLI